MCQCWICHYHKYEDKTSMLYWYFYFLVTVWLCNTNNSNLTQFAVFYVKLSHWCTLEESQPCFTAVLAKCLRHWHSPKVKSTCVLISWCWSRFWFISHSPSVSGFKEGKRRKPPILIQTNFLCEHSWEKKWKKRLFLGNHTVSHYFNMFLGEIKVTHEFIWM